MRLVMFVWLNNNLLRSRTLKTAGMNSMWIADLNMLLQILAAVRFMYYFMSLRH